MTELTQEQLAEIRRQQAAWNAEFRVRPSKPNIGIEDFCAMHASVTRMLHHIDHQAAKLAKVQELRDAIEAFMRSPQKKDDKARAWEFSNCIAYIKNGLDAILEGRSSG